MDIPSGVITARIYFVAVDATDLKTRETGLTSFTVYRSRDGGTATLYDTPTIAELSATNMPGVYSLLIDEDTTIGAGRDSEEYCVHITHSGMHPVTRVIRLYRPKLTVGDTLAISGGQLTAASLATDAITADKIAADAIGASEFAQAAADKAWSTATRTVSSAANITSTGGTTVPQTGDAFARLGAPAGASVSADIADIPTVAEFNARTLLAADYFDPSADTVANVTTVAVCTTNTDMRGTDGANTIAPDNAGIGAILVDTNELQTDLTDGGRLDLLIDAILAELSSTGEPGQGAPPEAAGRGAKIDWLYKTLRNKKEQTATEWRLFDDAGTTVDSKATVSDDGTTATKEEIISGP